jgi:hypothetical protein
MSVEVQSTIASAGVTCTVEQTVPVASGVSGTGSLTAGVLTGAGLAARLKPAARQSAFSMEGWLVWCGSAVRCAEDGYYYMLFSRWPKALGHHAWVSHSEIAVAKSVSPVGPWEFVGTALAAEQSERWDAHVQHNPVVIAFDGRYYLFYMGNRGNGEYWDHRNNQRIGVASADHPAGPWRRAEKPAVDVTPGGFDALMTSNPTVTRAPDGRFCMLYKGVGPGPMPKGGAVVCGVAFAEHPLGPWKRHPCPVISNPDHPWAVEDPFVWWEAGKYRCIVKDFQGYFSGGIKCALVLLESDDAIDWVPSPEPVLLTPELHWDDGSAEVASALERPQMLFHGPGSATLFLACATDPDRNDSFNVQLAVGEPALVESSPRVVSAATRQAASSRAAVPPVTVSIVRPSAQQVRTSHTETS